MDTDISWIWESPKLNLLAETNFKRYIAILYMLLIEKEISFDALIAGGNTGLIMGRLAQLTFDRLGISKPPMLSIPHQRARRSDPATDLPERTNKVFALGVYNQIYDFNVPKIGNLLFIDDEISKGTNAYTCAISVLDSGASKSKLEYYIVAEDQNFVPKDYPSNINIHFHPFAKLIKGLNNTIVYITPPELEGPLKKITSNSTKKAMMILMGLPIRDKTISQDNFDYLLNARASIEISHLGELMAEMSHLISKLIDEGIQEYKTGKINLSDFDYTKAILKRDSNNL